MSGCLTGPLWNITVGNLCVLWTLVRVWKLTPTPCSLCKGRTRGEMQFWIALAAPSILVNLNQVNSDNISQFIIFWTPVSYQGLNCLWRQRLLVPFMFSMTSLTKATRRHLAASLWNYGTFRWVIEQYCFHRYLCFHRLFCVSFFCVYCFVWTEWPYHTKTVFILIAL